MADHRPPLPSEEPLRASDPPLPPTEPLSHPKQTKRLGFGNADGSKLHSGPPRKKSRKTKETNGLGDKPPIGVSAAELQALEDGELEDSDDNCVTETYLVIDKKAKKKSPAHEPVVKRRESLDIDQQAVLTAVLPDPVKTEPVHVLPEKEVAEEKPLPDGSTGGDLEEEENPEAGFLGFDEDVQNEEEENEDAENPEIAENLDEFFDNTLVNAQQFAVIDDISQSDGEPGADTTVERTAAAGDEDGDLDDDFDSDSMDEEEIEAMLDADFEKRRAEARPEDKFMVREKLVLVERGIDPFDILPEGWVQVIHTCGMPIYLQQKTRVCTLSKPYFLGPGSAKKHNIPLSGIPCLQYRRALDEECGATRTGDSAILSESGNGGGNPPTVEQTKADKPTNAETTGNTAEKSESPSEKAAAVPEQEKTEAEKVDVDNSEVATERKTCPMAEKLSEKKVGVESKNEQKENIGADDDKPSSTEGKESAVSTEEKDTPAEDKSAAMILKLQADLTQLAALSEGSPSTSGTPSPGGTTPTDRNQGKPDTTAAPTDGNQTKPDAMVASTDGNQTKPDTTLAPTDGNQTKPETTVAPTDGNQTIPDTTATPTEESQVKADGTATPTDGNQAKTDAAVDENQAKPEPKEPVDGSQSKPQASTTTEEDDLELIAAKMIESSMLQDEKKVEAIVRCTSLQETPTGEEAMETESEPAVAQETGTTEKAGTAEEVPVCKVKIMSVEDYKEQQCLKFDQVHDYCTKLFQFKKVYVKRFKTWKARRAHERHQQKPSLPEGTKLLRCSVDLPQTKVGNDPPTRKKEFMLNPKGKSDVCILHEYAQHTMRVQPKYIFEDSDNALTPFTATILIHGIRYGMGTAASKKAAKAEAATETLKVLIPEFLRLREKENTFEGTGDLSFFNEIKVEDPRVPDLSAKAGQPLPYEILNTCLKRNYGLGDTSITSSMEIIRPKRSEFTMKVAKHEAKVPCKNKREGKQKAAQVLLQKMHPHINCWGSLLRLYARNASLLKEKKDVGVSKQRTCFEGDYGLVVEIPKQSGVTGGNQKVGVMGEKEFIKLEDVSPNKALGIEKFKWKDVGVTLDEGMEAKRQADVDVKVEIEHVKQEDVGVAMDEGIEAKRQADVDVEVEIEHVKQEDLCLNTVDGMEKIKQKDFLLNLVDRTNAIIQEHACPKKEVKKEPIDDLVAEEDNTVITVNASRNFIDVCQQTSISMVTIARVENGNKAYLTHSEDDLEDAEVATILSKCLEVALDVDEHLVEPLVMHRVTQTDWVGTQHFHKASQFPDHDYGNKSDGRTLTGKAASTEFLLSAGKPLNNTVYFPPPMPQFVPRPAGFPLAGVAPQYLQPHPMSQVVHFGVHQGTSSAANLGLPGTFPVVSVATGATQTALNASTSAPVSMGSEKADCVNEVVTSDQSDSSGPACYIATPTEGVCGAPKPPHLSIKDAVGMIKESLVCGNSGNPETYENPRGTGKGNKQTPSYAAAGVKPTFTTRSVLSAKTERKAEEIVESSTGEEQPGFIGPKVPGTDCEKPSSETESNEAVGNVNLPNTAGVLNQAGVRLSVAPPPSGLVYPGGSGMVVAPPQQRYMYPRGYVQPMYPPGQMYYPGMAPSYGYMYPPQGW